MTARIPASDEHDLSNIPAELADRQQWLLWRSEKKPTDKKPRKMPYYVNGKRRTGEQGSDADRAELVSLDTAKLALATGKFSGVGLGLLPGDGLIGIDLDGMIDPDTGEISERGSTIIAACNSYTEFSPSGTGVHIICSGTTETFKSNEVGVEVFCGRQFFTFTGHRYSGTPPAINPLPAPVLKRLKATVDSGKKRAADGRPSTAPAPAMEGCAKVESALAFISPDCGYDDWIKLGMAIHHELGDGGFSVWNAWSMKSAKFPGESVLRGHWKSFRPGAVTGGTLFGLASAAGWRAPRPGYTHASPEPRSFNHGNSDGPKFEPDWPEPMLPGSIRVPPIPAALLPSWVGEMARAVSDSTQTPEAMSTMLSLSVLATCLQRQVEVAPYADDYTEPLALWTLQAMQSGSRKTAVINALAAPLLRWEKLERDRLRRDIARVNAARAVAKKRIEKLTKDAANADSDETRMRLRDEISREEDEMPVEIFAPKLFTGDTTAETLQGLLVKQGERMAVLTDEAGIFLVMAGLYSGGNASLDVFLQGHAGSPVRVDRADREAYLERPALSFGLALQPGVLADVAGGRRFRDSGLLARFLYAIPESNVGKRDVRRRVAIPETVSRAYEKGLFGLLDGRALVQDKPKVLPFTDRAREAWLDFAEEIEHGQCEGGKFEAILDWTSKLPGAAARIAGLIEVAEVGLSADSVSQASVERAVELCRLLIPHAHEAFGLLGADSVEGDATAILKWAKANGLSAFKRSSCQKAMEGRFRSVDRLIKAAERLEQRDVMREFKEINRGAPPSVWYRVNPKCFDKPE
jgi:putative DNA primase/helicase